MSALRKIAVEILGLFVDDRTFAVAIIGWLSLVWLSRQHDMSDATAYVLFTGLASLLLGSTVRYAAKQRG